jgi:F-type H+-transporting ATPase subunit a
MNISLAAEPIFHIGSFPVTNTLLVGWVITLALSIFAIVFNAKINDIPGRLQNIVEMIVEMLFGMVDSVTHDREKTKKFFPIVATIFIAVIASNWVELVPGLGSIGIWEHAEGKQILIPFIRSSSADLNFTAAIALVSFFAVQIFGVSSLGVWHYAGKFFVAPWKKPYFIGTFVGLLEFISEFSKVISFTFRLFGNIFAGEILLLVIGTLVPYIVPLPFLLLEIFVGFVQALVFSMLTLVFLTGATTPHESAEHVPAH